MKIWLRFSLIALLSLLPALLASIAGPFFLFSENWYTITGSAQGITYTAQIGPYQAILTSGEQVITLSGDSLPQNIKNQGILWTCALIIAPILVGSSILAFLLLMLKWRHDPNFWRSFRFSLLLILPAFPLLFAFFIFAFIGIVGMSSPALPDFVQYFHAPTYIIYIESSWPMFFTMYVLSFIVLFSIIVFALLKKFVRCNSYFKHAFAPDGVNLNGEANQIVYVSGNQYQQQLQYPPQPIGYQPASYGGYQPQPQVQVQSQVQPVAITAPSMGYQPQPQYGQNTGTTVASKY